MKRILLILILFISLLSERHAVRRIQFPPTEIILNAVPVPLSESNHQLRVAGSLRYLGGWYLNSPDPRFGGISSMYMRSSGELFALSDSGILFIFRPRDGSLLARMLPLPAAENEKTAPLSYFDTESMAVDPLRGLNWVAFEFGNRICRYGSAFTHLERCRYPPAMKQWPRSTGAESMVRLPDGRFIVIAESATGPLGFTTALLFKDDPTDPLTPPPAQLAYNPPVGFVPTDALWLGNGKMLILNRRVSLTNLFTAVLTLVEVGAPRTGQIMKGQIVARFEPPLQHDNFEALTLSNEEGCPAIWVASDDNHLFFQRTLLMKFALPNDWVGKSANARYGSC